MNGMIQMKMEATKMFNRIPEPPLDPPEDKVYGYCDCRGGEIYEGETIYRIDGETIHEDCLHDFADQYFSDCKEEAEPDERRWLTA